MKREDAIRKLKSCLALAASSNPHEAAAALRQAHALMRDYGLTADDAQQGAFSAAQAPTRQRGEGIPKHLAGLASLVASTFACKPLGTRNAKGTRCISFCGLRSNAEIAAYAFTVLRRQLEADAAVHTRRMRSPTRKAAARDAFAHGWVAAVRSLLVVQEMGEADAAAIDRFMAVTYGPTTAMTVREARTAAGRGMRDAVAGYLQGQKARLHRGVEADRSGQAQLAAA